MPSRTARELLSAAHGSVNARGMCRRSKIRETEDVGRISIHSKSSFLQRERLPFSVCFFVRRQLSSLGLCWVVEVVRAFALSSRFTETFSTWDLPKIFGNDVILGANFRVWEITVNLCQELKRVCIMVNYPAQSD